MKTAILGSTDAIEPVLSGAEYRKTHRASVMGILGAKSPPVSSRGSRFFNIDKWTARLFVDEMCKWAKANPGCVATKAVMQGWINTVNAAQQPKREIVIANTPERLPLRTALALTGGAYHEALHTHLSCRRQLRLDEMANIVLPRWAKVKDWSKLATALLEWSNIIEDVRNERRGCEEFEHIWIKMCDLQDFILYQEAEADAKSQRPPDEMSIIARTFRDVGLGYATNRQQAAIDQYKEWNTPAFDLVVRGPLKPMLDEAIALSNTDDLGSLRVAMDVIAKLAELGKQVESDQQAKKGQAGDGQQNCPSCGASPDKMIVRPKSDGRGGKVPGKGVCTCTVCGFQQDVDVTPKPPAQPNKAGKEQPGPKFEGFDSTKDEKSPGKKNEEGKGNGSGKDEKKPGEGQGGGKGSEGSSKGSGKDGEGNSSGEGPDKAGKEKGKGASGDEEGSGENGAGGGAGQDGGAEEGGEAEGGGSGTADGNAELRGGSAHGAGGHHHGTGPANHDWGKLIENALKNGNKEFNLLDSSSALEGAVEKEVAKEQKDTQKGEAPWAPYDPGEDTAALVQPSAKGKDYDNQAAAAIIASVKEQIAYLRSRFRTVIRSMEQTKRVHGVPKGRLLSTRYLVDTKTAIRGREMPQRAYMTKGLKIDMSMAAAVVIDESSSMDDQLETATRIMMAICEPLDALGFPTLALGFRDGRSYGGNMPGQEESGRVYHRVHGMIYDIFKLWNEKFRAVKWRFANTRADGGTPMADGVQYALTAISQRNESHRFIFVVTDGMPNGGHAPVIKRQIRQAREAGITIIGVGIGPGSKGVVSLFDDHVYSDTVEEFPKLLMKKINDLIDIRAGKRGTRVRFDPLP